MRTDSYEFSLINRSASKEPRYVIEVAFDTGNTDLHYFTSHADCLLPSGASATLSVVERISGTTQKVIPDQGRAEIGSIAFSLVDKAEAVSTLIRAKEAAGYGLRRKRVRVYVGFKDASFTDFASHYRLVQTQIIEGLTFEAEAYRVTCSDVQRSMRQDIFDLATTNLTATLTDTGTAISVGTTAQFERVAHGASYSDAPNATVGYVRIDDEIIRYTGKTASTFTGCTRGVLGTKASRHEITAGADADRQPEVTEVVYLEMPVVKLALAILTGDLYGQTGKTLPSGWHLGIDPGYVATSAFTGIGLDLWDPSDDTAGRIAYFVGLEKQDGKRFIETELMNMIGCFMPVLSDGSLSLRRRTAVLAGANTLRTLNSSNVVSYGALTHNLSRVHNVYSIAWNWDHLKEEYTRTNVLLDSNSIATHGQADPVTLEMRGLSGYRFTAEMLGSVFDSLRDSFAGPPLEIQVTCLPSCNDLEVGDVVQLDLRGFVRDAAASGDVNGLNRAMEVQQVQADWITGEVRVSLFGSSQAATPLSQSDATGAVLPDEAYTSEGTDLTTVLTISVVNGIGHVVADGSLTGNADMRSAVYYYDGDLTIDAGVTVTIDNNVQIRVKGYFTNAGTIDGAANGLAGNSGQTTFIAAPASAYDSYAQQSSRYDTTKAGTAGGVGRTRAAGTVSNRRQGSLTDYWDDMYFSLEATLVGVDQTPPAIDVRYESGALLGIPSDLRGTSGGGGGCGAVSGVYRAAGGAGGAGGAGLLIISRGGKCEGSGAIDLSGAAGQLGGVSGDGKVCGGSGAGGAPGGMLWVVDGPTNTLTGVESRFTANSGATPTQGHVMSNPSSLFCDPVVTPPVYTFFVGPDRPVNYFGPSALPDAIAGVNYAAVAFRAVYATGQQDPEPDVPETTGDPGAVNLWEYSNTPKTATGNRSTIEAWADAPSDGNYKYSKIYYRPLGVTPWKLVGPAWPEALLEVASDGSTYEFQARSVSLAGVENKTGPTATITVTDADREAPAAVTGFAVVRNGTTLRFTWEHSPFVKYYEIRRGASWASSVLLARPAAPPFDVDSALAGTYLIKPVDLYGVESITASSVVTNDVADINIVVTHDEAAAGWAGTCTNTFANASGVALAGTIPIEDFTSAIDTYTQPIAKGAVINTSGTYETSVIDLLTVLTARVEIEPTIEQVAIGAPISSWTLPIDSYGAGWTIAGPLGIISAAFEIATSDDNVTWSSWRTFVTGNYSARYIKFRVTLTTGNNSYNCRLTAFEVSVDVPDREITWEDHAIPLAGKTLSFSPAFFIPPVVSVAIQNGAAGDSYRITNKTESGMDINLYDSTGAAKAGNVDIRARAY